MKILGDPIFSKNPNGTLKSRIGTLFFRTPGLVTQKGVHAMQRIAWVKELNRERAEAGQPELTEREATAEWADAFKADEVLQTLVSKRRIRFLNTHAAKVRDALRARGENWRMARAPQSAEEIDRAIAAARVAIQHEPIYYYNANTGTRYLTAGSLGKVCVLPPLIHTPVSPDCAFAFNAVKPGEQDDAALRSAVEAAATKWRLALPANLRDETSANLDWRNTMSAAISRRPNETEVGDQDLIQGISPEFYRQIEWLPGGSVVDGQLIFDPLFDEAQRTQDPELLELCDFRVRSIIFNLLRLLGTVEYVNIGRIAHSLARRPIAGQKRGNVYIVQYKEVGKDYCRVFVIRFQKWGIAEHLDAGKDLLHAIFEASEYADYILDRRLACRQLGMNLPHQVGFGQFTEKYLGHNQYYGTTVRAFYYLRSYIRGIASDKVPPERFRNPAFARAFATLMGEAAALDMIVGRAATETGECLFDTNYEVLQCGEDGLPCGLVVTDHTGSFVKYRESYDELVGAYANVVRRREKFVGDYPAFAKAYVQAFERRLAAVQAAYRTRRRGFDELFLHRPYDQAGSGAFRWTSVLKRLDGCDPAAVAAALKKAIQS